MVFFRIVKVKVWRRKIVRFLVSGMKIPSKILVVSEKEPLRKILIMLEAETVGPTNASMNFLISLSAI